MSGLLSSTARMQTPLDPNSVLKVHDQEIDMEKAGEKWCPILSNIVIASILEHHLWLIALPG